VDVAAAVAAAVVLVAAAAAAVDSAVAEAATSAVAGHMAEVFTDPHPDPVITAVSIPDHAITAVAEVVPDAWAA